MRVFGHVSHAALAILFLSFAYATNAAAQDALSTRADMLPTVRGKPEVWVEKCSPRLFVWPARASAGVPGEVAFFRDAGAEGMAPLLSDAACAAGEAMPMAVPARDNPCRANTLAVAIVARPCHTDALAGRVDPINAELSTLGRAGAPIAFARGEVLDILASANACSEWFNSKDDAPADTFRSLNFELDRHGQEDVLEWRQSDAINISRQPYVARTTQDGGPHTIIGINANGAFYRAQGNARRLPDGGGPAQMDGSRRLRVASYMGNTLEAQVVTLLHEFGHIIDLLPEDSDDLDGRSAENTNEVLRHCRGEIESRAREARQARKK